MTVNRILFDNEEFNEYTISTNRITYMEEQKTQLDEILEIVVFIKDNAVTKEEFGELKDKVDKIEGRMDGIEGRMDGIEGRMDKIEGRMDKIENKMVTKDYLDDKLADLKGDLVIILKKEDKKVNRLIQVLSQHEIVPQKYIQELIDIEVFPKISLV